MKFATELIILNTTKLGEKSLVVHCITPDYGRRSFLATIGQKTSMALFQTFNIIDAEVVENPKSDLWRLNSPKAVFPLTDIRQNLYKNAISLFMSEVLYRTVKDGDSEHGLYEWCRKSILTLEELQGNFSNFHLRFILELALELGFEPEFEDLQPFVGEYYSSVRQLVNNDFCKAMLIPLNGKARNDIAELLLKYLSYHTESNINVRSLRVLRELF